MGYSFVRQLRCTTSISAMDNFVFKLCYRWTVWLLVAFSFIVTCRLWFGNSFSCITQNDALPLSYVNIKCYDEGVYFVPWNLDSDKKGKLEYDPMSENDKRYQSYYSWVNLVFLVHALNFYLPHLLWKSYGGKYIFRLTGGILENERKQDLDNKYLANQVVSTLGCHGKYILGYNFFEACNFAVSLAQTMWLIHFFQVTGVSAELKTWSEYKNFYFPDEAACQVRKLSASGDVMTYKALCQLPLNSLYMKMFLFLRAWYILLTVLSGLVLINRIVSLLSPFIRFHVIRNYSPLTSPRDLKSVVYHMRYTDWFVLGRLQMVMSDLDFSAMTKYIAAAVDRKYEFRDATEENIEM